MTSPHDPTEWSPSSKASDDAELLDGFDGIDDIDDIEFIEQLDDPSMPIDAPIETPIVDALDQRRTVILDETEHDPS